MRGMMKWQPFKSLSGQYRVLEEHEKQKRKVDKPDLSTDEIEDINALLVSLTKGDEVIYSYYDDGMIIHKKDAFLKCDPYEQKIIFKSSKVGFNSLLGIKRAA